MKTTGSNTKNRPEANADTVTYVIETEAESAADIILKDIQSQKNNIKPTATEPSGSGKESTPPTLEEFLPIDSISAANLPPKILQQLWDGDLTFAHFVTIAPNTTAALCTRETLIGLPPGYVVVLVFDEQTVLPHDHIDGKVYIVE